MNSKKPAYKMVLLGNFGTGKTSIVNHFIGRNELSTCSTIGASFHSLRHYYEDNKYYSLNIWDTAGQERYRSITQIYFNGVDVGIIVYDMMDIDSLIEVEGYWIKDFYESRYLIDKKRSELILFVVGNKSDMYYDTEGNAINSNLHRGSQEILQRLKDKYADVNFFEVSAKTGENLDKLKENILYEIDKKIKTVKKIQDISDNIPEVKSLYLGPLGTYRKPRVWCNLL